MVGSPQLFRSCLNKDTCIFNGRLNWINSLTLLIHKCTQFLINLIHAYNVIFQFPYRSLLVFKCLQINFILKLSLSWSTSIRINEVVLKLCFWIAVACWLIRRRLWDGNVWFGLTNCILLDLNALLLYGLKGCKCRGEFIYQAIPLNFEMSVLAIDYVLKWSFSIFD